MQQTPSSHPCTPVAPTVDADRLNGVDGTQDPALRLPLEAGSAASSALIQAQEEVTNLRRALESRTEIGVALGILVERHKWSRDQAFRWLSALSQNTNTKVVELAGDLIEEAEPTVGEVGKF